MVSPVVVMVAVVVGIGSRGGVVVGVGSGVSGIGGEGRS